jgi:predicted TPR repeat methyltransferase
MNRKQRRLAAKSQDVQTICRLAATLKAQGRLDEAAEKYRLALKVNPRTAGAHNNLANLLREQGHLDEAIKHYNAALELEPASPETCNNLGNAVKERGRFDVAITLYRDAIRMRPDFAEAHNNLGTALVITGQFNEAIAHYRRALELDPRYTEARLNLGLAYADQGQHVEALEQAETASRSAQDPSFPHHLMGVLLARTGCPDGARVCFDAYLARDPEDRYGVRLMLAGLGHVAMPERASASQLDRIYARRATSWDRGAAGDFGYRGADLVGQMLDRFAPDRGALDIADAGCGTGLVGARIAQRAGRLVGIDMSEPMLEKAREKGVYHRLHQGDLVSFLNNHPQSFDAVTCAATLIHFGDLRAAFMAAASSLRAGGLFIFTLFPNESDASTFAVASLDGLAQGGCYAHGRDYVARLAEETGFAVEVLEAQVHEYFRTKERMGLVVVLRRAVAAPSIAPDQKEIQPVAV